MGVGTSTGVGMVLPMRNTVAAHTDWAGVPLTMCIHNRCKFTSVFCILLAQQ